MTTEPEGVFLIYTGGTIGSMPKDPSDPFSPLVPHALDRVMASLPYYDYWDQKLLLAGRRIPVGTYSWAQPVDSSNMTFADWAAIARVIQDNYDDWEGFVVIQGTDTLAYTSSALAFMLGNLDKPVIVTGAQKPIGQARQDAVQNLVTAIEIAAARSLGCRVIPEVCVFFRDSLFRGCRTTKLSASDYDAFGSPNCPPLAKAGEQIVVNPEVRIREPSGDRLDVFTALETNIASLDLFPGMSTQLLRNILTSEGLRGLVLQTFGTGNAPTEQAFLQVIGDAVEAGSVIVDVTQCRSGTVELGLYDASAGLLARGVVSGLDMTPDAALTKLAVVLGKTDSPAEAADLMQINLRGEQKQSIFHLHYPAGSLGTHEHVLLEPVRPMVAGDRYQANRLSEAYFRLMGLELADDQRGRIEVKAYLDDREAHERTGEAGHQNFLGRHTKRYEPSEGPLGMIWRIDEPARRLIDQRHLSPITLVNLGPPVKWTKLNLALYADC